MPHEDASSLLSNSSFALRAKYAILVIGTYFAVAILNQRLSIDLIWIFLVVAVAEALTNTRKFVDQVAAVFLLCVGWSALFGWVKLPSVFLPQYLVLAFWIAGNHVRRPENSGAQDRLIGVLPLMAPVAGATLTWCWWHQIAKGEPTKVLQRLLPIWDHSGHFNLFLGGLLNGKFLTNVSLWPPKSKWVGSDYPAGIHQVWAQFFRTSESVVGHNTSLAIPMYANAIVVTLAICVGMCGVGFMRLGQCPVSRIQMSMLGSGLAIAFLTLGPLSQSVYVGFPNLPPVCAALCLAVSFLYRPSASSTVQVLVVGGSYLTLVYNWYPAAILILPALLAWTGSRTSLISRKKRILFIVGVMLASAPAIIQTLSLGLKHLEQTGGIQAPPQGQLVLLVGLATATPFFPAARSHLLRIALLCLTPVLTIAPLAIYLRIRTGGYPYYFSKMAILVAFYAACTSMIPMSRALEESPVKAREDSRVGLRRLFNVVGALLVSLALTFSFGYWGFDYLRFSSGATAIGVLTRNNMVFGDPSLSRTSELIIREGRLRMHETFDERQCFTFVLTDTLTGSVAADKIGWINVLSNIWFHGLTRSYTYSAMTETYKTTQLGVIIGNDQRATSLISSTLDSTRACVATSQSVVKEIKRAAPLWRTIELTPTVNEDTLFRR